MYLCLLFHHCSHELHLSHSTGCFGDNKSWTEESSIWYYNFLDIRLQFILDPKRKWSEIIFRNTSFVLLFVFVSLFFFGSFKCSFDSLAFSFDVGKLETLVCAHLLEDHVFKVSGGNDNWNSSLWERVDIGVVFCCQSAGWGDIKNAILSRFFLRNIVLNAEVTLLGVELVSVQINNVIFEILAHATLLDVHRKSRKPFVVLLRIFFGLIFKLLD